MILDIEKRIADALREDMPSGDVTTDSLDLQDAIGRARVVAKEDIVFSGSRVFQIVFHRLDPRVQIEWLLTDGAFVMAGQNICTLHGPVASILKGERVALNFLGRMSGIATLTRCYVEQLKNSKTRLLDTRKTTPLLRDLEKEAVIHGGGYNHRHNLSDAVLLKDNHIDLAGGISRAVELVRKRSSLPITCEVRNLEEVQQAVTAGVARILLDNMTNDDMAAAVKIIPGHIQTEASGNMHLERIASVAALGVDFISVGAITHSAPTADLSLVVEKGVKR